MVIDDKYLRAEANNFTVLRLVLASSVIYTHSYGVVTGIPEHDDFNRVFGAPISFCAVDGFFFLSGFLVYPSLLRMRSSAQFLLSRLTRLWPALAVSVLLVAIGGLFVTKVPGLAYLGADTATFFGCNLSLACGGYALTGVNCDGAACNVNGSLWTLTWEFRCYLALAALGVMGMASPARMKRFILPATLFGALVWDTPVRQMVEAHLGEGPIFILKFAHRLWPLFALGAGAYIFRHRLVLSWWILGALFLLNLISQDQAFALQTRALFVGYAVLCFGILSAKKGAVSGTWPDYSYGTYIFAYPIMMVLYETWHPQSYVLLGMVNLALTLPVAALSWHLVEKPALDLLKRLRGGRVQAQTPEAT